MQHKLLKKKDVKDLISLYHEPLSRTIVNSFYLALEYLSKAPYPFESINKPFFIWHFAKNICRHEFKDYSNVRIIDKNLNTFMFIEEKIMIRINKLKDGLLSKKTTKNALCFLNQDLTLFKDDNVTSSTNLVLGYEPDQFYSKLNLISISCPKNQHCMDWSFKIPIVEYVKQEDSYLSDLPFSLKEGLDNILKKAINE